MGKKAYDKLSTDLLVVQNEGAFMGCSVRIDAQFEVENYHTATFENSKESWDMGFDD